jgi:hypothetical protein
MRKRYLGKFEACDDDRLAEVLYSISLDGCDDSCGEAEYFGWYGLILHRKHGYVVSEDSQGFFCYERFETKEEAQTAFDAHAAYEYEEEAQG